VAYPWRNSGRAEVLAYGLARVLDTVAPAEVKAVITKITKPRGWCVLNAHDPRTFAMRLGTKAQIWVFTRDPDSPSACSVLSEAGRVTTLLEGWICVLMPGADPLEVIEVMDVPLTLTGLSTVKVENALAVTSATLALGFSVDQVADGLATRSWAPSATVPLCCAARSLKRAASKLAGFYQISDQCWKLDHNAVLCGSTFRPVRNFGL